MSSAAQVEAELWELDPAEAEEYLHFVGAKADSCIGLRRWRIVWSKGGSVQERPMQVEAELRELDPAEAEEYLQSLVAKIGSRIGLLGQAAHRWSTVWNRGG